MARVEIPKELYSQISKKFKKESVKVLVHLKSLEKNPKKGKLLSTVGAIAIKELKYKSFRFYFLVDEYKIKVLTEEELIELLIRFVRMSNKKYQQETINEIRKVLQTIGSKGVD